jgi:hypothetical protein
LVTVTSRYSAISEPDKTKFPKKKKEHSHTYSKIKGQQMYKTQRIAIKYFIIGIATAILTILIPVISETLLKLLDVDNVQSKFIPIMEYSKYTKNIVIGVFLLVDSFRMVRNKISISILGFCLPIIGVCFLMVENYLLQKSKKNE